LAAGSKGDDGSELCAETFQKAPKSLSSLTVPDFLPRSEADARMSCSPEVFHLLLQMLAPAFARPSSSGALVVLRSLLDGLTPSISCSPRFYLPTLSGRIEAPGGPERIRLMKPFAELDGQVTKK
jgi:hypothetical protein